ncbi:hypothetical protein M422DRAFT_45663 [Sphaerobolus stellatus SS14]|nr:hypothetical protein M422DRAFT_45663 [Sphaerobolus stellatus SS14]
MSSADPSPNPNNNANGSSAPVPPPKTKWTCEKGKAKELDMGPGFIALTDWLFNLPDLNASITIWRLSIQGYWVYVEEENEKQQHVKRMLEEEEWKHMAAAEKKKKKSAENDTLKGYYPAECYVTNGHKACKPCQDAKQRCSFVNHEGVTASPEVQLVWIEELLVQNWEVVLEAGLWNAWASLHQSAIMALQLHLGVMEAENHEVLLPIGFQEEVDVWAAKMQSLQMVTASKYAGALDLDLDTLTANMSLAYKRRPPETGAVEEGPSNGYGTMEGERRKKRKCKWRELLEEEEAKKQKEKSMKLLEKDAEKEVEQVLEKEVELEKEKEKETMKEAAKEIVNTMDVYSTVETLGKDL